MNAADLYKISLKNLLRNRLRTIVNSLIIAIGICVLIITSSLSQGIKLVAENQILKSKSMREITVLEDNFSQSNKAIDYQQLEKIKNIEHVSLAYPDVQMTTGLYDGAEWLGVGNTIGVPSQGLTSIIKGEQFKENDKNVVIVPNKLSFVNGYASGEDYIGKDVQIEYSVLAENNQQVSKKYNAKVIGVYDQSKEDLPRNTVFIPIDDMYNISAESKGMTKENYFKLITFHAANVLVSDEKYVEPVSLHIEEEGFRTNSVHKELNNMPGIVKFIIAIGGIITLIVLISGAISIGITMLNATKNREKEIGLMKAIGYLDKHVFRIFLIEAIFTGLLGGLIGLVISYVALYITENIISKEQSFTGISLSISITTFGLVAVVCLLVPFLGGIFPVLRASRISPSEALRSE